MEDDVSNSVLREVSLKRSLPGSGSGSGSGCRWKLQYSYIWNEINKQCSSNTNVQQSLEIVFGANVNDLSFGTKAQEHFDDDMEGLLRKLEKVCRLLKDDDVAQRSFTEILYESSVAVHNESPDTSKLSDTSLNHSFENINTSRSVLDISLNDTLAIEQRMNPAKRRPISFSCETIPDHGKRPTIVQFTTPQPLPSNPHTSIAKMSLSEARKNGHRVTSLADFTIIKPISKGAYGKVYLAKRQTGGDYYAIKIMRKDDLVRKNMVDQVVTERDALALAKSPFIVKLFYSFQSAQEVYFVMEYLIGGDMSSFLSHVGCMEEEHAMLYMTEVALALNYLHKHSIIHKDIKPENMLLDKRGHIKLTDFGLSSIRLQRKLTISDLVYSPYNSYSPSQHWRTPGQLLSLTSNIAFRSPTTTTMSRDTNKPQDENTTKKRFIPIRCSFGGSNNSLVVERRLSAHTSPIERRLSAHTSPSSFSPLHATGPCVNWTSPSSDMSRDSGTSPHNTDCSAVTRYSDEEVSFGDPNPDISIKSDSEFTQKSDKMDVSQRGSEQTEQKAPGSQISKIIGTPDYIAPELLLRRLHTCAADWWSFGICMYELIVGIPPFHDTTIIDIFKNILNSEIEWPEDTSDAAKDIICRLLEFDPTSRAAFSDVQSHVFFGNVDWERVLEAEMPFVPNPENDTDTGYFERDNADFEMRLSDFDGCIAQHLSDD